MLIIEFTDGEGAVRMEPFSSTESDNGRFRVNGYYVTESEYSRVHRMVENMGVWDIREHPRFIFATTKGVSGT